MRDNCLSNRIFTSHNNILDHCREAWNKLVVQPWRIMTIGRRKWARGFESLQVGIAARFRDGFRTARKLGPPVRLLEPSPA